MTSLAQVIGTGMYDNGPAKDALRADQLDEVVLDGPFGVTLVVCFEVAKVADVTDRVRRGAVFFREGIDWIEDGISF